MTTEEITPAERLQLFKEAYFRTGNITGAYREAGYSAISANKNAHKYFKDHREEIMSYVHTRIAEHVPAAVAVMVEIMMNPEEKGGIRIKAASDLLDRAGYKPSDKIEIRTEDMEKMSTGDIKDEIRKLLREVDPELGNIEGLKVVKGGKS